MRSFLVLLVVGLSSSVSALSYHGSAGVHLNFILGEENLGAWRNGISAVAEAPAEAPVDEDEVSPIGLAGRRTERPDILRRFRRYRGGWDITNRHYWASVGFTGAVGFILAVLWFVLFGVALMLHHCCGWRIKIKGRGSKLSQTICLIMLIVFTCAAAIGSILLSVGQDEFYGEVKHTLKYVVNQSDYTVQTLRNVTQYLSLAKTISVAQVYISSDVMNDIDKLNVDLKSAADTLTEKTNENSRKITRVFNVVRSSLITVAAVMLLVALLGLVLSILGYQHAIHIFIVSGWFLVTVTFILCGVFLILNNTISDTCMAMEEWVNNPHAEAALRNILPCVDHKTTNQTLIQSRETINNIVSVVNQFIYTNANSMPQQSDIYYYNQSGPLMPPLCFPFDSQLQDRQCGPQEVSMTNASLVWQNYICTVSAANVCTTVGRVTPSIYTQLVAAVNESYALEHYTPPLLSLQDCNFVKDTFREIISTYCPPLDHHLKMVDAGLGLISVGVMLCLILWILYANRPPREAVFVKASLPIKGGGGSSTDHNNSYNNVTSSNNTCGI